MTTARWQGARELLDQGRADLALAGAVAVMASDTADPRASAAAAWVMLSQHFHTEAIELATRSIRTDITCEAAYLVLGMAYDRREGSHDRALLVWSELLEMRPKSGPARVLYGESLQAAGLPQEALAEWRTAAKRRGGSRARYDIALLTLTREGIVAGRRALAEAAAADRGLEMLFARAVRADEAAPKAVRKGLKMLAAEDPLGAAAIARRELDARPDDVAALALAARALAACGSESEALAISLRALTLRPGYPPALAVAGSVFAGRGGLSRHAVATFEGLASALPHEAAAWVQLAEALLADGRYGDALRAAANGMTADPSDVRTRYVLAFCLLLADRHTEAWWHVRRAADHEVSAGGVVWALLEAAEEGRP